MLNNAPIFVNGFQRGGTSLVIDLLLSHPDVCGIGGETHQMFFGKGIAKTQSPLVKWSNRFLKPFWAPVLITARQNTFSTICLQKRNQLPYLTRLYVDYLFYWHKLNAEMNQYKSENVKYTESELKASRLLAKNLDGVVLATDVLEKMYPDATYIALIRNGFAICEGFVRRGYSAEYCGKMYQTVCQKMIRDAERLKNYHLVKFEDLLADHISFTKKIYEYANLDFDRLIEFRMYTKKSMGKDGTYRHTMGERDYQLFWLNTAELNAFLRKDVNLNQVQNLSTEDRETFLNYAEPSLKYFGYL
ncbi:sulfotransferase [Myxosarcina sp. GI1]|uniref:sulfotransferase family protein n=1 Tax=Myxosarcina sp. GI1 TaxID=1541065 RepID=UPI0005607942|nr:sulfotransferase [Myxosarcina sp. GI1]